jgi:hypothetical protein
MADEVTLSSLYPISSRRRLPPLGLDMLKRGNWIGLEWAQVGIEQTLEQLGGFASAARIARLLAYWRGWRGTAAIATAADLTNDSARNWRQTRRPIAKIHR